jgi:hypothetical protein
MLTPAEMVKRRKKRPAALSANDKPQSYSGQVPKLRWPEPLYVSQISDHDAQVDFLWDGCLARGHITLLSALMKCGKSTLLGFLLRALQCRQPFLGRTTKEGRTLIVSEESRGLWCRRRDALALDDHLSLLCRPMLAKPSFGDWQDFIEYVGNCAAERKIDLVLFDTIGAVAPWKSENDAAEVQGTMTPLNRLTGAGLAVGLIHHIGKADGSEGRAARGSTALAGAVDILLEMRRYKPDDKQDRRRVLSGLGRFEEVPDEVVIELAADGSGYTAEGDRKAVAARELAAAILDTLPDGPPGLKADDVHTALPEEQKPKRGDVMRALRAGAEAGTWQGAGTGRAHDPRRFWKAGN